MAAWLACVLLAGACLAVAAQLAERACLWRGRPARGAWLAAMACTVALPWVLPHVAPARLPVLVPASFAARAALPSAGTMATGTMAAGAPARHAPGAGRGALAAPWLLLSLATAGHLAGGALRLRRRARQWRRSRLEGTEVWLSTDAGPAVFGLWRPAIVLPEWFASAPAARRRLALEHEREHLRARDPQLLAVALALLALMPWNLPLWWQLHRLRCAIELDCDRRVLRAGGDLLDYCETLIELGQRGGSRRGLMAAVGEPASLLEKRILMMSMPEKRWHRAAAAAFTVLAVAAATAAAALTPRPPAAPAAPAAPVATLAAPAPAAPPMMAAAALPAPPPMVAPAPPAPPALSPPHEPAAMSDGEDEAQDAAESAQERADEAKADAEAAAEAAREAKADAEQQAEEARQAKADAEEQVAAAEQAKRDAEQQAVAAEQAKRAAEAAEAEARQRRQEAGRAHAS